MPRSTEGGEIAFFWGDDDFPGTIRSKKTYKTQKMNKTSLDVSSNGRCYLGLARHGFSDAQNMQQTQGHRQPTTNEIGDEPVFPPTPGRTLSSQSVMALQSVWSRVKGCAVRNSRNCPLGNLRCRLELLCGGGETMVTGIQSNDNPGLRPFLRPFLYTRKVSPFSIFLEIDSTASWVGNTAKKGCISEPSQDPE